ncbi:MAG: glycosyltransferase [Sphingobacteriales bacterium]|nr:MAG: glycosyltransferase [Sphingobacteriales bacterium]
MRQNNTGKVVVSICMITYNHAKYIVEAIEGVLMQKTDFRIQLVIGEDSSPDDTREICETYAAKYPDIIRLLPSDRRYGMINNFFRTIDACDGDYIAICDGDDYWNDPYKLQKQVDVLHTSPDISVCVHATKMVNEKGQLVRTIGDYDKETYYSFKDNIISGNGATSSMLFRMKVLDKHQLGDILKNKAHQVDWSLDLLLLDKGRGCYLPDIMGVYRKHSGGVTSDRANNDAISVLNNRLFVVNNLKQYVSRKHRKYLNSFLGLLLLKSSKINKEKRTWNLISGAMYLLRYPHFLFNISKVKRRFNPFV